MEVVEELAPSVKLGVGLDVGDPESVEVLVEDGETPKLNVGVGVLDGLDVNEVVLEVEELAPTVKLDVGV